MLHPEAVRTCPRGLLPNVLAFSFPFPRQYNLIAELFNGLFRAEADDIKKGGGRIRCSFPCSNRSA